MDELPRDEIEQRVLELLGEQKSSYGMRLVDFLHYGGLNQVDETKSVLEELLERGVLLRKYVPQSLGLGGLAEYDSLDEIPDEVDDWRKGMLVPKEFLDIDVLYRLVNTAEE